MSPIIAKPLELLRSAYYLVFPMFAPPEWVRSGDAAARAVGRIALFAAALAALAAINQAPALGLSNVIRASSPWVGQLWLPLLATCLYAMLWLGWWLYRLLTMDIEPISSEFPDIDRAWGQATEALTRAEIGLDAAPMFLVLGWPSATEEELFRAAGLKATVRNVPSEPEAPLHVTASRDGIWLTCPGASLLGQYRHLGEASGVLEEVLSTMAAEEGEAFRTMGMGPGAVETLRVEDFQGSAQGGSGPSPSAVARARRIGDAERHLARLRHLCRLIVRDRRGFCPINGVLVTLPIGVDDRRDLAEIADACRRDLNEAFDAFRMRCPVLALVNGLEQVDGFRELVQRLPPEQVRKRMGQRFPLVPDLTADEVPEKVQESVEVVTGALFPSMVHTMFQVESRGLEDVDAVLAGNIRLYRLLGGIIERGERVGKLVRDCLPALKGQPVMFGGCYFAGTGRDPAGQQAFASGVLMRMIKEDQDSVTWTDEALDRDAAASRLAGRIRIALIAAITLGVLAAAGLIFQRFSPAGTNPRDTETRRTNS